MKLNSFVTAGLIACAALTAPAAHAAFINGSASLTGFFQNNTTALGVPTSIVSRLTSFDVQAGTLVGSTSGDLQPDGFGTAFDFSILSVPQQLFAFNGFNFTVTSWGPVQSTMFGCSGASTRQCSDGIGFSGAGVVTKAGFDATAFTVGWSAQGSCNENLARQNECAPNSATASWSASISATGTQAPSVVPEPASLALVGLALTGMGLARRRRA